MKTDKRIWTVLLILAGLILPPALCAAEERIQLAVLLGTSNSMDGLIARAKSQLWKVVNELARAGRHGRHPSLEVALVEYGNDGLAEASGYIRVVSDLTADLDLISERLFGLTTNGGVSVAPAPRRRWPFPVECRSWEPAAMRFGTDTDHGRSWLGRPKA